MTPTKRAEIFRRLKRANPRPTTELKYRTPFELLVSVILSAQATDKSVNKATAELFKVARTPRQILDLGLHGLKRYIRTIGLYNTKAANIRKTCKMLLEKHGGQVPATREELQALPGVGRKTASVVLSTAYKVMEGIAVDTHVRRVSMRLGLAWHDDPKKIEIYLMEKTPKKNWGDISNLLIAHGRKTCIARTPRCAGCVFKFVCPSSRVLFPGCKR